MFRSIELLDEQVTAIVVDELKTAYLMNRHYSDDFAKQIMDAADVLLKYYLDEDDYNEFREEVDESRDDN